MSAATSFSLFDSDGRLRAWLLLPPASLMVGIGHFWLPSIPPASSPPAGPPPRR